MTRAGASDHGAIVSLLVPAPTPSLVEVLVVDPLVLVHLARVMSPLSGVDDVLGTRGEAQAGQVPEGVDHRHHILLSTFGGLSMFGAVGLVLGPIIAALFIAVWQIYGEAFGELLRTEGPSDEGGEPGDSGPA